MPLCEQQFFFSVLAKNSLKILYMCFDYKKKLKLPQILLLLLLISNWT